MFVNKLIISNHATAAKVILIACNFVEITEFEINEDDAKDDLPFACFICREEFKNPVVTRYHVTVM